VEFRERVGARIRAQRKELGLSQSGLARRLPGAVETVTVGRWERGESFPNYDNLSALAKVFGLTEEQLLTLPISKSRKSPRKPPRAPEGASPPPQG
jgi:transcriptional regulator with XRE-family HTH domain